MLELRPTLPADVPTFFAQQLDDDALRLAAFTSKDPRDRAAHDAHWGRLLANERIVKRTIVVDGQVAGYLAKFERDGVPEVSYWLGRPFWGRGLATQALTAFVRDVVTTRPLTARIAFDNAPSRRVLEKCGFVVTGHDRFFANARGEEIDEDILTLGVGARGPQPPVEETGSKR